MRITTKLDNMKKATKLDIHSKNEFSENIILQSAHKIAVINPQTGTCLLSKHCFLGPRLKYATEIMWATTISIPPELLAEIIKHTKLGGSLYGVFIDIWPVYRS